MRLGLDLSEFNKHRESTFLSLSLRPVLIRWTGAAAAYLFLVVNVHFFEVICFGPSEHCENSDRSANTSPVDAFSDVVHLVLQTKFIPGSDRDKFYHGLETMSVEISCEVQIKSRSNKYDLIANIVRQGKRNKRDSR